MSAKDFPEEHRATYNAAYLNGIKHEQERIIMLLNESSLVCKDDFKCSACDEWQTFNETDYSFCEELFKEIKEKNK